MRLPCLIKLAATSVLIAAKLEEIILPSFDAMIDVLSADFSLNLSKKQLIAFEFDILRKLEFNVRSVSSIQFLERYFRLFGIDQSGLGKFT